MNGSTQFYEDDNVDEKSLFFLSKTYQRPRYLDLGKTPKRQRFYSDEPDEHDTDSMVYVVIV